MKAEEKTVAFMFFSVVMQFVYSLGGGGGGQKQQQKKKQQQNLGDGGRGWRGTREEG